VREQCDDGVSVALHVSDAERTKRAGRCAAELPIDVKVAEAAARAVADQSGFRRRHGACFNCGRVKDVTESTDVT
jgi:CO dehydrogenase/acetyl-CoA synthase alpha subunit